MANRFHDEKEITQSGMKKKSHNLASKIRQSGISLIYAVRKTAYTHSGRNRTSAHAMLVRC